MHIRRARRLLAVTGAMLLLAPAVGANHATASVSVTPNTTNAYGDVTISINYGADEPATLEIAWPTGWLIAQQTGTSPISPIPDDEERVGGGTLTARWVHLLCGTGNLNITITWEATIGGGAPANTVGQLTVTSTGIFNTDLYIVRNGTNDYDFLMPNLPTAAVCSSTTDGLATYLFEGETADGDRFLQNPSTPGTYCFGISYTDTNAGNHGGTNPCVAIV